MTFQRQVTVRINDVYNLVTNKIYFYPDDLHSALNVIILIRLLFDMHTRLCNVCTVLLKKKRTSNEHNFG
jgi:hypothetical protein